MEFSGNKVYLDKLEQKTTCWSSPIVISSGSLSELSAGIQHTVDDINEMMSGWDVIMHGDNIDLTIARNRMNCRIETYRTIARYAVENLPDIFSSDLEQIDTPEEFLELTK